MNQYTRGRTMCLKKTHAHVFFDSFYRAMHYSAKRGLAIACRLSVCLTDGQTTCDGETALCLSACDVGGSGPQWLEILETNCTDN